MEFKRDEFVLLEAQTTVHLGRLQKNLRKGDIVEYDGYTLKFGGTTEVMPELRAGVKRGWLTITDASAPQNVDEAIEAQTPSKPKKEMAVETVYEEERAVSEVAPTGATKEASAPKKFPLVVESQDEDMISVASVESKSGAIVAGASSAEVSGGGISESQGAEPVGQIKIKTASKQKTVISDGSQASQEISRLDNLDREDVIERKPASDSLSVEDDVEVSLNVEPSAPEDTEAVENSQILSAIDGEVQPDQGAVSIGKDESKVAHLPSGVEWDMSPQWRKRAKIAYEKYSSRPEVLDEIIAVETKGVANALKKLIEG